MGSSGTDFTEFLLSAQEWERLERSAVFTRAPGLYRLLRYLAAHAEENADGHKEVVIGSEFFGRDAAYDPRYDGIVRTSVSRLRKSLRTFYDEEGKSDPFRIEIPRGTYKPVLVQADLLATLPEQEDEQDAADLSPGLIRSHLGETLDQPRDRTVGDWSRSWWMVWVILVLAGAGIAGMLYRHHRAQLQGDAERPALAIVGIRDPSNQPDTVWIGVAIGESLSSDLAESGGLRVLSGDETGIAERDIGLKADRSLTDADLEAICRRLGCGVVLTGSYLTSGDQIRVDLSLVDVRTGKSLGQFSETALRSDLPGILARAGRQMRAALRLPAAVSVGAPQFFTRAQLSEHYLAEGLRMSRAGDQPRQAQEMLSKAALADPESAQVHAALANQWGLLRQNENAADEARLALAYAHTVPAEEQLPIEAQAYAEIPDYPKAVAAYTELLHLHPGDATYTFALLKVYDSASMIKEESALLSSLAAARSPLTKDLRYPEYEAFLCRARGDQKGLLLYAGQAMQLAEQVGARSDEAALLRITGVAWSQLGDTTRAAADLERAEAILRSIGDTTGVVSIHIQQGMLLQNHHDPRAEPMLREALAQAREMGSPRLMATVLVVLGNDALGQHRTDEAVDFYQQAIAVAGPANLRDFKLTAASNTATALLDTHEMQRTQPYVTASLAEARSEGSIRLLAANLEYQGRIDSYEGRLDEAEAHFRQAAAMARGLGELEKANSSVLQISRVQLDRGNVAEAQKVFDGLDPHAFTFSTAELKMQEAQLAMARGDTTRAAALATAADAADPDSISAVDDLALVGEVQLGRGDLAQAGKTVASLEATARRHNDLDTPVEAGLLRARIDLAAGHLDTPAVQQLDSLLRQAKALRWMSAQLRIRIALGVLARRQGSGDAGLKAVAADARRLGYGALAAAAERAQAN